MQIRFFRQSPCIASIILTAFLSLIDYSCQVADFREVSQLLITKSKELLRSDDPPPFMDWDMEPPIDGNDDWAKHNKAKTVWRDLADEVDFSHGTDKNSPSPLTTEQSNGIESKTMLQNLLDAIWEAAGHLAQTYVNNKDLDAGEIEGIYAVAKIDIEFHSVTVYSNGENMTTHGWRLSPRIGLMNHGHELAEVPEIPIDAKLSLDLFGSLVHEDAEEITPAEEKGGKPCARLSGFRSQHQRKVYLSRMGLDIPEPEPSMQTFDLRDIMEEVRVAREKCHEAGIYV